MLRRSSGLVIGLGLASTLLLAACGGSGSGNTGGSKTTSGKTAASPATQTGPEVLSNGQDQLNLPLNAVVFGTAGTADGSTSGNGFDSGGNVLNAQGVPTGNVPVAIGSTKVTFWVPKLGSGDKSAMQMEIGGKPLTVTVQKPAAYKSIYLLEGAGNGPLDVNVTANYTDGSSGTAHTVQIDDWCTLAVGGTPAAGAVQVLQAPNRLNDTGSTVSPACGMEGIGVTFNSGGKTVKSITFSNVALGPKNTTAPTVPRMNITAATLVP